MRIVQLIDSLETGGAERMAVNYANSLSEKIAFSGLIATRDEGPLKSQLSIEVPYLFLEKKKALDRKALFKLRRFVQSNKVEFIHAHGSSFFMAVLLKFTLPSTKIVWHDHYGNSEFLEQRSLLALWFCSWFFEAIISVNTKLETWAKRRLNCKKVIFLANFVTFGSVDSEETFLKGAEDKRIVCLANLREQKNHLLLLEVAKRVNKHYPEWTFHLIGKDFKDGYSKAVKQTIEKESLSETVFVYGSREDIKKILEKSEIALLTSDSEGLPVAVLEYGYYGKAVLATDVGQIGSVIENNKSGFLVSPNNIDQFYSKLEMLITNPSLRWQFGKNLKEHIVEHYTNEAVMQNYLKFLIA